MQAHPPHVEDAIHRVSGFLAKIFQGRSTNQQQLNFHSYTGTNIYILTTHGTYNNWKGALTLYDLDTMKVVNKKEYDNQALVDFAVTKDKQLCFTSNARGRLQKVSLNGTNFGEVTQDVRLLWSSMYNVKSDGNTFSVSPNEDFMIFFYSNDIYKFNMKINSLEKKQREAEGLVDFSIDKSGQKIY